MNFLFKALHQLEAEQKKKTPTEILLYLGMAAVFMLFLPLLIKLLRTRFQPVFPPNEFALSTLLLMTGSWLLYLSKLHKAQDRHKNFRWDLLLATVTGCFFLLLQILAVKKIFSGIASRWTTVFGVMVIYHAIDFLVVLALILLVLVKTMNKRSGAELYIYFLNHRNELIPVLDEMLGLSCLFMDAGLRKYFSQDDLNPHETIEFI